MATATPADALQSCFPVHCASRAEWLALRRTLIGASESAAIFGVGYADQSALTVWDAKVNGEQDHGTESKRLRIGRRIEPALRSIFTDETGLQCESPGENVLFRRTDLPWLGATLDGLVEHPEHGVVPCELKNVSGFLKADWEGDEPPLKFNVQVQHQMAVTGAPMAYVFGLIGGNEPAVKIVPRDEGFIAAMLRRLEEFWGYVERREMPPVDASYATAKALARLHPLDNGESVALSDEAAEWDAQLATAQEQLAATEKVISGLENKIKAAIGDNTYGLLPDGGAFSWKTQTRRAYQVSEATFRVLRRTK